MAGDRAPVMVRPMDNATEAQPTDRPWRLLFLAGGLLTFVGGAMHPEAPDGLTFRQNLAVMMDDPTWVPGHALTAIGAALLLAGFVVLRRRGGWPSVARLLPVAIVTAAIYTLELVVHTASVVDKDELASGDMGLVTVTHLALAVVGYPLFGLATAAIAWRLLRTWPVPLWPFAVLGIVGGVSNALAAPLTILPEEPDFAVFFPIGGIGTALWYVAAAGAGVRRPARRLATAAA